MQENRNLNNKIKSNNNSVIKLGIKTILTIILLCFVLFLIVVSIIYSRINQFNFHAGLSNRQLYELVKKSWNQKIQNDNGHVNFLILGLDRVANKPNDPLLSDTMMLVSLNLDTNQINLISLPRDLWLPAYQTKINALYFYGLDKQETAENYVSNIISEMTQLPIHHVIVIQLNQLSELIDLIGGIQVSIPHSFTDTKFPREDVKIGPSTNEEDLYETISFQKGTEYMTGSRALKYIRSRHSNSNNENNDDARNQRQQIIIKSLINKLMQYRQFFDNPELAANLFIYYKQNFDQQLDLVQLLAIAKNIFLTNRNQALNLQFHHLSLNMFSEQGDYLLVHPPIEKYNQWVFEIKDLNKFRAKIKEILYDKNNEN